VCWNFGAWILSQPDTLLLVRAQDVEKQTQLYAFAFHCGQRIRQNYESGFHLKKKWV